MNFELFGSAISAFTCTSDKGVSSFDVKLDLMWKSLATPVVIEEKFMASLMRAAK